jgi:hypothetical protein
MLRLGAGKKPAMAAFPPVKKNTCPTRERFPAIYLVSLKTGNTDYTQGVNTENEHKEKAIVS